MIDGTVRRAIRQGMKTAAVEHKGRGPRQNKRRFAYTSDELSDAMQLAREQREAEDFQAKEPTT